MNKKEQQLVSKAKKEYIKPQIYFAPIEVEEALMAICKSSGTGPLFNCAPPCYNNGS